MINGINANWARGALPDEVANKIKGEAAAMQKGRFYYYDIDGRSDVIIYRKADGKYVVFGHGAGFAQNTNATNRTGFKALKEICVNNKIVGE